MRFANVAAGIVAACVVGSAASAATVTVTFGGTVNNIYNYENSQQSVWATGDRLEAVISYDDSQTPLSSGPSQGLYSLQSGTLTNVTQSAGFSITPSILAITNHISDNVSFGGSLNNGSVGFDVRGFGAAGSLFGSSSVSELTMASLQPVNFSGMFIELLNTHAAICSTCDIYAQVDSVSFSSVAVVPVPAALPLMGLGLAGLGFAGRRWKR